MNLEFINGQFFPVSYCIYICYLYLDTLLWLLSDVAVEQATINIKLTYWLEL